MVCINESGLYSLILTSRKPQAKKFKKWVTSEVLPAIRKTGNYSLYKSKSQPLPSLNLEQTFALAEYAAQTTQSTGISQAIAQQIKLEGIIQIIPQSKPLIQPHIDVISQYLVNKISSNYLSSPSHSKKTAELSQLQKYEKVKNTVLANPSDSQGNPLSNRAIAKLCGVSHTFVNDVKKELFFGI